MTSFATLTTGANMKSKPWIYRIYDENGKLLATGSVNGPNKRFARWNAIDLLRANKAHSALRAYERLTISTK